MNKNTDWKSCMDSLTAKRIKPDEDKIKSLLKASKRKLESEGRLGMDEVTSTSKFSLAYESLRELLEALAIKNGYKIYNHECYTYFLKEIIDESTKGDEFDAIRKIRNGVNYYGKELAPQQAEKMIKQIKELRNFVNTILSTTKAPTDSSASASSTEKQNKSA